MGNYKSQLKEINEEPFHPNLQNPQVHPGNDEKLMTISFISNRDQFKKWKEEKANYKQMIKNSRHLFWPRQLKFRGLGFCGTSGYLDVTFPYCPVTLKNEIFNRSKGKTRFEQKQLWYLMHSLISLAEQVHRYSETVGDIRPLDVLLSQKGQVKVMSKHSVPAQSQNVQKTVKMSVPTYLSPEQCELIRKNQQNELANDPSSECFSIGITLLATSILRLGYEIYQPPKSFQKDILEQFIRQLQQQTDYSEDYKFLVKGLCEIKPKKRFTSCEVLKCLRQYEKQIYDLLPFEIGHFSSAMRKKQSRQVKGKQSQPITQPNVHDLIYQNAQNNPNLINPNYQKNHTILKFSQNSQNNLFRPFQDQQLSSKNSSEITQISQPQPHYISRKSLDRVLQKSLHQQSQLSTSKYDYNFSVVNNSKPFESRLTAVTPYKKGSRQYSQSTPTQKAEFNPWISNVMEMSNFTKSNHNQGPRKYKDNDLQSSVESLRDLQKDDDKGSWLYKSQNYGQQVFKTYKREAAPEQVPSQKGKYVQKKFRNPGQGYLQKSQDVTTRTGGVQRKYSIINQLTGSMQYNNSDQNRTPAVDQRLNGSQITKSQLTQQAPERSVRKMVTFPMEQIQFF